VFFQSQAREKLDLDMNSQKDIHRWRKAFPVNRLLSEHTAELNSLMGGGLYPPPCSLWIDKIGSQVVEETYSYAFEGRLIGFGICCS